MLVVTPYLLLNYSLTNSLLPTTVGAKIALSANERNLPILRRYINVGLPILAGAQFAWIPGIVWGIGVTTRHFSRRKLLYLLPLIWAFAHLTLYVLRHPTFYHHGRYMIPIIAPLLLFAVGGMILMVQAAQYASITRIISRTLALSAIVIVPIFWWIGGQAYEADVRIINTEIVKTAKWLTAHPQIVPEDELLAVHDIGALGYYAPREILDIAGLVSPEVIPIVTDPKAMMQLMCERDVKWLMVLPYQNPTYEEDPRLELVYSTNESFMYDVGGAGNMKVYRLHFDENCLAS